MEEFLEDANQFDNRIGLFEHCKIFTFMGL